ncbi:MAG: iron-sulfur cluster assembly scaffold protein [Candidatus Krumholzibacteria bacterium]|nr:iron-sulfur cluster assembly scaffold protein [Candidatus Krumholzibacteria bacterium]
MEFVSPEYQDHFLNPRNVGLLEEPDGTGMCGSSECGDWLIVTIRVEKGKIGEIGFQCRGCSAAIATSSAATELARGRTIEEASRIAASDIEEAVGGLPEDKRHCSVLGEEAIRDAIADYIGRSVGRSNRTK